MESETLLASGLESNPREVVGPDQEVWIRERILTAMKMALAIRNERRVEADTPAMSCALEGIANGTAVEIVGILGMEPSYENLRKPR